MSVAVFYNEKLPDRCHDLPALETAEPIEELAPPDAAPEAADDNATADAEDAADDAESVAAAEEEEVTAPAAPDEAELQTQRRRLQTTMPKTPPTMQSR